MKYKLLIFLVAFIGNLFIGKIVYAQDCPPGFTRAWTFFPLFILQYRSIASIGLNIVISAMSKIRKLISRIFGILMEEVNDAKFGQI
ncbi:hypothetical protein D9V84_10195 [Bacteroidetes/Chlorobi group bacterium Naka2016]|jgi:hypothetical protein|nr:MAG: hypothetical protein D9V84_10195 [Bacteroidetes/Chlorobi group bacterium Naka2016]